MRWSNVPLPEPYLAAIVGAAGLHLVVPLRFPLGRGTRSILGGGLLTTGIGLAAWAVASAEDADVEGDSELLTSGAYALTRNPMYMGWSIGALGLAVATGSAWLLAGWAVAVAAIDREIDAEESRLLRRFGATYTAYHDRVPRYLPSVKTRRSVARTAVGPRQPAAERGPGAGSTSL
jgi:protein-S-isoprenylcysteine O-methyltransferase Ste14